LSEYAYFTLAVLVAGGVGIISGPISAAILPRLTRLAAQRDEAGLIQLYRNATQLVAVIAVPAALMLGFFAEHVLWAWTGDAGIASKAAPVLALYAIGNGILALGAFPYYLQFAKGDMRLHMIGNILFLLILIPALIWATLNFGVRGAGCAWLCTNVLYFLFWVPTVHRRLVRGLHRAWLMQDVAAIVVLPVLVAAVISRFMIWPDGRLQIAGLVCLLGLALVAAAAIASSYIRKVISGMWLIRFPA
jgi:O-antigen/teichoic acid export membrane protein